MENLPGTDGAATGKGDPRSAGWKKKQTKAKNRNPKQDSTAFSERPERKVGNYFYVYFEDR